MPSLSLGGSTTRTWGDLVRQDPAAKAMLLYCELIKEPQSGCASTFFGFDKNVAVSTVVARKAAWACLESQHLKNVAAFTNLFNEWSEEAKAKARSIGWETQTKADAAMRVIEHSEPQGAKPLHDEHDVTAGGIITVVELLIDAGNGYGAALRAGNDPLSVGVSPDRLVPNTANPGEPPAEKKPPQSPPSHEPETPHDTPPPVSTSSEIIFRGDIMDVDLTDDIIATPVIQDETTRTAMQACHESVKAKLWQHIGSVTTDPNAETPEEGKAHAEWLKSLGMCDKDYYGGKTCAASKKKQDDVPLRPDEQAARDQLKQHSVCPANMVSPSDCNKAKQQLFMRFVMPDFLGEPIKGIFHSGKAIPYMPRLNLDLGSGEGGLKPSVPGRPPFKTKDRLNNKAPLRSPHSLLHSHKRKSIKAQELDLRVSKAIEGVKLGKFKSANAAAIAFRLRPDTVRKRISGVHQTRREARLKQQLLSKNQEIILLKWIKELTTSGYAPSHQILREVVDEVRSNKCRVFQPQQLQQHQQQQQQQTQQLQPKT
ncbi:hypothetical protein V501_01865 [Pseudogymnoascus sp. VKM F-4519 (FW-2642)]|nr:hypothetical protein V501_01865 [Pseudogymnoascus sp. VKM F-4519 (FW-2642)]